MTSPKADFQKQVGDHLAFLYGPSRGPRLIPALLELLESYRATVPPRPYRPLTQHDSLLITYADQVLDDGLSPLSALGAFLDQHIRGLVSAVHLLPFYPWTSDDGFAVVDYLAVDPRYGRWSDVERLGDRFDLMFDLVCNHTSTRCEWFQRFLEGDPAYQDFYVTVEGEPDLTAVIRPRTTPLLTPFSTPTGLRRVWTTFSADQVDLNYRQPAVLLQMLRVLLEYVRHGARFLRLDAVAFLWKEPGTSCLHLPQTHRIVQLFRTLLADLAPDVRLVTETNVPHAENVAYFGNGTNEAHLVYNFALPPLVLHSFRTGQARELTEWARQLVTPSPETAFLNYLASHDGIGLNPARGILAPAAIDSLVRLTREAGGFVSERATPDGSRVPYELNINYLDALSPPPAREPDPVAVRKFATAHAIVLSLPGMPALYFHSLFGSRGDREGALASGIPRRINRQKLQRRTLERELDRPDYLPARVYQTLARWLRLRKASPAFAPAAPFKIHDLDPRLFVIERLDPDSGHAVLCLHNVSPRPVRCSLPTSWHRLPVTCFDGTDGRSLGHPAGATELALEPWQSWWGFQEPV
ncbi:sugar phosphorylase [Limisphaera sp. VF-2]|uniref:sugar phosphorylase n=1 Tax=Limisphaera sp. VF-2 TaxID=3400418 RepID=UPI003C1F1D3D